jgi:hypothetical protein
VNIERLRRRVAFEAARLIYAREETQYGRARRKAVERLTTGVVSPCDLPNHREIRRCVHAIERSNQKEQARLLAESNADRAAGRPATAGEKAVDRFRVYEFLLLPLEHVEQSPEDHPEGDALYHSLQVFELARQRLPYDEEFLLAALLHDVGKAIDRREHVAAALEALAGVISLRTAWLIEHHVEALAIGEGTLGVRRRRRLEADDSFEELTILAECDRGGRAVGMVVPDVHEAIECLRRLADACDPPDEASCLARPPAVS